MRPIRFLLLLAAAAAAYYLLTRPDDETRIRRLVADLTAAFNEGDVLAFLAGVAEDFRDETTGFDREALRTVLRIHALRQLRRRSVEARVAEEDVNVELRRTGEARVQITAMFRPSGGGKEILHLEVEGDLVKRNGQWRFRRTRHRWAGPAGWGRVLRRRSWGR